MAAAAVAQRVGGSQGLNQSKLEPSLFVRWKERVRGRGEREVGAHVRVLVPDSLARQMYIKAAAASRP